MSNETIFIIMGCIGWFVLGYYLGFKRCNNLREANND